jgi:hypothetical protein
MVGLRPMQEGEVLFHLLTLLIALGTVLIGMRVA